MEVKRTFYRDPYNSDKVWEVVKLSGGYYLRQYVKEKQFGRGLRTTKRHIQNLGIFEYEETDPPNARIPAPIMKKIFKEVLIMYGEYEDRIRKLDAEIGNIDERVAYLSAALELVGEIDEELNDWLNGKIKELDYLKEQIEQEIDILKEQWRQSRPRTDYRPMDNTDLIIEIRVKGCIEGSLI